MRPTHRFLAAIVPVALLLVACGDDTDSTSDTTETTASDAGATAPEGLVSAGTLTLCSDTPYEPFQFRDDDGKDVGFDIDLMRAVADSADLDLAVIDLPFDGILGSLEAGDCDVVASALTIDDERSQQVDFTDPYFDSAQSLLIKTDQAAEITELADLDGAALGVQSTTTGEDYANENATGAEITAFEDSDGLFGALEAGTISGILQDLPVNGYRSAQDPTVTVIETYPTDEQYGFAVRKGNTDLLDFLNTGLETLRSDGDFDEIYALYFGAAEE